MHGRRPQRTSTAFLPLFALLAVAGCDSGGGGGADVDGGGSSLVDGGGSSPVDGGGSSVDAAVGVDGATTSDAGVTDAASADAATPDTTPPGPVTDLVARPGPGKIGLTWTRPSDGDLDRVAIRVSLVAMPDSPDDGSGVPVGTGEQAVFPAVDGLTHYVAAFAIDSAGNVSERAEAVAVPRGPWRSGPDLPLFRPDPTATAFDGGILVAGRPLGQDAPFLVEYDPSTDSWTDCGTSGCAQPPPSSLRTNHAAVRVGDRLLLFGGCIGSGGACSFGSIGYRPIEYDRSENLWTSCGSACTDTTLTRGDVHHVAESIGTRVYVTGGTRDPARILLEEYDPAANAWTNCGAGADDTACADAPEALRRPRISSLVIGGEMHVLAGEPWDVNADDRADHLVYSPATNEWRGMPAFPAAHAYLVGIIGGSPYAIGARAEDGLTGPFMYRWDGAAWVRGTVPLPFVPFLNGVPNSGRVVSNGEAYFFGGINAVDVVIYDPLYDW
jgi:hypothetical protein